MLKGEQPISPACFSSANGASFSASPNADLGVNFYAPPPVVTTFSTLPMQNMIMAQTAFFPEAYSPVLSTPVFINSLYGLGSRREGLPLLPRYNLPHGTTTRFLPFP